MVEMTVHTDGAHQLGRNLISLPESQVIPRNPW
jgi:hypothetical protein